MALSNDVMLAGPQGLAALISRNQASAGLWRHGLWQIHPGRAANKRDGCSLLHSSCALRCRSFSTSRNPSLADCLTTLSYLIPTCSSR